MKRNDRRICNGKQAALENWYYIYVNLKKDKNNVADACEPTVECGIFFTEPFIK